MRDVLDFYIRSLAEREDLGEAPEFRQDLGTFFDWLLERLGYTVHMRSYKHLGSKRVKSAGQAQWGVDILASKPDANGDPHVYLFVMKQGDIGPGEWSPKDEGSMAMDLWDAATKSDAIDKWYAPADPDWKHRTVVAVHNGDLRKDKIGPQVEKTIRSIEAKHDVKVEWWDADKLVSFTLSADGEVPDSTLFPPAVRPPIRMALDSLKKPICGGQFDYAAIDQYLAQALPGADTLKKESNTPATLRIRRHLSELTLVASLIEEHARRDAEDTTFPTLDSIERMLCRSMTWIDRLPKDEHEKIILQASASPGSREKGHEGKILEAVGHLIDQYIRRTSSLKERIDQVASVPNSLSLSGFSECLDYPMRVLRISGYLALTGLILLDKSDKAKSLQFAETIKTVWDNNPGGALAPITDDHVIEISLVFELWCRLDLKQYIKSFTWLLIERLAERTNYGLPLPAIWQRASIPLDAEQKRVLAETLFYGRTNQHPLFVDNSSTIVMLCIYLGHKMGVDFNNDFLERFASEESNSRSISLQSWKPAETAASKWYVEDVSYEGITQIYAVSDFLHRMKGGKEITSIADRLVDDIEQFHRNLPYSSLAAALNLPSIDRIAWKRWRIPMGMHSLVALLAPSNPPTPSPAPSGATPPSAGRSSSRRAKVSKPSAPPSPPAPAEPHTPSASSPGSAKPAPSAAAEPAPAAVVPAPTPSSGPLGTPTDLRVPPPPESPTAVATEASAAASSASLPAAGIADPVRGDSSKG